MLKAHTKDIREKYLEETKIIGTFRVVEFTILFHAWCEEAEYMAENWMRDVRSFVGKAGSRKW